MSAACPTSSKISLEILVHTSARVTNSEDERYRAQGQAILSYLNNRAKQADPIEELPSAGLENKTPSSNEILVPNTTSDIKHKSEKGKTTVFSIAETILLQGESSSMSNGRVGTQVSGSEMVTRSQVLSIASFTSSTVSLVTQSLDSIPRSPRVVRKTTANTGIYQDKPDSAPTVSPDSARFTFLPQKSYQNKKRQLEIPSQSPRKVEHPVLAEQSPNKRRKLCLAPSLGNSDEENASQPKQLNPPGWLSSLANLTSSSPSLPSPLSQALPPSTPPVDRSLLPPYAPTSAAPYKTHLVGALALIAESSQILRCWRPRRILRTIHPLERGYWHLSIPFSWSSKDQDDFWELLTQMIGEGRCGWGVWVEHVPARKSGPAASTKQGCVAELKVWCWGEVVREVFLALVMASRRLILRLGLEWVDARGECVVWMK